MLGKQRDWLLSKPRFNNFQYLFWAWDHLYSFLMVTLIIYILILGWIQNNNGGASDWRL